MLKNAFAPKVGIVVEFKKKTVFKKVQPLNAAIPMLVTAVGIIMLVIPVQS